MSLINDALKKAQRQRTMADPSADAGTAPAAGRPGKRGRVMPAQTLLLLAVGAATLIVLTIVGTVWLVHSDAPAPATRPAPATVAVAPATVPADVASPVIKLPDLAASPTATPAPAAESTPEMVAAPVAPAPTVAAATPTPTPPPAPVERAPVPSEQVYAYLDKLQVMGIRSSGTDSKVLMNDRVFRVNDIVDRGLDLRLVKVESDTLTFRDGHGVTYTKKF